MANRSVLRFAVPVDGQTTESTAIDATAVTMEITLFKEPIQQTANQDATAQTLVSQHQLSGAVQGPSTDALGSLMRET